MPVTSAAWIGANRSRLSGNAPGERKPWRPRWLARSDAWLVRENGAFDETGSPLLIDPTSDDPWEHLFLDADTGYLVARWHTETGQPDPRGTVTTDGVLLPVNIEAVTSGRLRTIRRLRRAVRSYLQEVAQNGVGAEAGETLLAAVADNDDYGISCWFFHRDGAEESPFAEFRTRFPAIWEAARALVFQ